MRRAVMAVYLACLMAAGFSGSAMGMPAGQEESAAHDNEVKDEQEELEAEKQADSSEGAEDGSQQTEETPPSIAGTWTGEEADSRYMLEDGSFLEKSWLLYKGDWYYLDEDGYPALGWKKIRGDWYYFGEETGKMAVGWAYSSEEDEWYYLNEDGTRKTGWLEAGGEWYWFDSDGIMYDEGWRMVDGHKYYFNKNGQMAASQYIETNYYGADGLRDARYDIIIQGKRKPTQEERQQITEALENVPRQWMERFVESGWELMYYTDRKYFEAPMTDEGIYYVHHKTDANYKKLKFTEPSSLTRAFGEYVAHETGNDGEKNVFLADLYLLLDNIPSASRLPSYFDDDSGAWFGILFENYVNPEIRSEMKIFDPQLCSFMAQTLNVSLEGQRPSVWEMTEEGTEEYRDIGGRGPAYDPDLNPAVKRAQETAGKESREEKEEGR